MIVRGYVVEYDEFSSLADGSTVFQLFAESVEGTDNQVVVIDSRLIVDDPNWQATENGCWVRSEGFRPDDGTSPLDSFPESRPIVGMTRKTRYPDALAWSDYWKYINT